ncbi:MAG: multidrug effflux MFS transporter [Pseudomonadota bacterium]
MNSAAQRLSLALLVAVAATGPLALNIFMPAMPEVARSFGAPYGQVQLTLSVFFIGLAVGQVVYGPLSDQFGRRPIMIIGLAMYVAASLLCMLASTVELLIVGRAAQGFAGCAGIVLSRAIIGDVAGREKSASLIAYVTMAMVVVPMLAPSVGGFISDYFDWHTIFVLVLGYGVIALVWVVFGLRETNHQRTSVGPRGLLANYARLSGNGEFRAYAAIGAFGTAGFFGFLGGAPYVIIEIMGRTPFEYGLFFFLPALCYIAGNFVSARLATKLGIDRLILIGSTITAIGAAIMLAAGLAGMLSAWAVFLPMMACAFGNGLTIATSAAGAISAIPTIGGTASGYAGFLQMGLGAFASWVTGSLVSTSQVPIAAVMLIVATCAALIAIARWRDVGTPRPAAAA